MSLLLTIYNSPHWKTFAENCGLSLINEATPQINTTIAVLQPTQSLPTLSAMLSGLAAEQTLWSAVIQAEYFLADAVEHGSTLTAAAQQWAQQTKAVLDLQRQQRRKLQLFNLHQALENPAQFQRLLNLDLAGNNYAERVDTCNISLLAASQYLAQQHELQALNTLLQASVLPLCDSEVLTLNIEQILLQNRSLLAAAQGRDLLLSQLHHVQEELEKEITAKNAAKKTITELEAELKKTIEDRGQLYQQLEKVTAEKSATQQKNTQLEADYQSNSEERDFILTQLHHVQEQLEQYYLAQQTEQQQNKHTLLARDKQHAKEITKLEAELRKTKARASSAEYAGQLLQKELEQLRTSISWKAARPVRVIGRIIKKKKPANDKLTQDIGLLLTSEYFDVEWYLRTYTDVAESQMNPAEHYLRYGAAEGRLPGPHFDGNWYLQHYPDVAESKMNPLLHFVMFGQQEGRTSSPKMLTNNQGAEDES